MNYIFIVNPISGNKKALAASKAIKQYLSEKNIKSRFIYTAYRGEAISIASAFKDDPNNVIYSVGGDGTLNEVVNGFFDAKAKLGIIPAGTGNDFFKTLEKNHVDKIDVGKVNNKHFINIASIGLDAEVADIANNIKSKYIPNNLVYYLSLIKALLNYNNIKIMKNSIENNITLLAVCNGIYYGGGFPIAPNAILDDGKLDICEVNDLKKLEIPKLLLKLIKGNHLDEPNVNYYKADGIKIESSIPLCCNVDGEVIHDTEFDFSINKNRISLYEDKKIIKVLRNKKIIK